MVNIPFERFINRIVRGDCISVMQHFPDNCVDLVVTDPPYVSRYQSRTGQTLLNDNNSRWMHPSFAQVYRVLKADSFCVSTYGWHKADHFLGVWRSVGLRPVGHFVWVKNYASSTKFTRAHHENAYLLMKGNPPQPADPPKDVMSWKYTRNRLHPTQKPVTAMLPFVRSFSQPGDLVLDPFCGSGTTAEAATRLGRNYIGIELDTAYCQIARDRLAKLQEVPA